MILSLMEAISRLPVSCPFYLPPPSSYQLRCRILAVGADKQIGGVGVRFHFVLRCDALLPVHIRSPTLVGPVNWNLRKRNKQS